MSELYDPAEHRPLAAQPWSEQAAQAAIAQIAADAVSAYQGPQRLWPNDPADLEGEPDVPYRNVYLGAAGVVWALKRLAAAGLGPATAPADGGAALAVVLADGYRAAPELEQSAPGSGLPASLLFGESGILLSGAGLLDDPERLDRLADCVTRNRGCPTRELCWGSPGTMVAALSLWRATGDTRWSDLWRDSADWLLAQWADPIWVQDMYGQQRAYVGAGHGFAANVMALWDGRDLLGDRGAAVAHRAAEVIGQLAIERDGLVQWPATVGEPQRRLPVQWCHGAPGIVVTLAGLPADPPTDRLLVGGGELTWTAGPLRKGPGLCHGTAGNGYAFLALHARSGDPRWLQRARAFAMDAAADVHRRRVAANGRGRYSLFTGDLGVAMFLRSCLTGDARFPLTAEV